MPLVDLQAVLDAKEKRAAQREDLRQAYGLPVLTFSINRPGPEKDCPETRRLLRHSVACFRATAEASKINLPEERYVYLDAGPYALIVADSQAETLKKMAVDIENNSDYGRLLDIDVYDASGTPLSRHTVNQPPRTCFLCHEPAVQCMRDRRHSLSDLHAHFQACMVSFKSHAGNPWAPEVWDITQWALESMLAEAACTPAPGLVDRINSGAHDDMDFFTFMKSTASLTGTMSRCAAAGLAHAGPADELLPILRRIGCEGEHRMFASTQGINTQKGLIFLMGILCAATAALLKTNQLTSVERVGQEISKICEGIVSRELAPLKSALPKRSLTAGERLFLKYQTTGIRGEMENGLPSVLHTGLPCFRAASAGGLSLNDALVQTLLSLMTVVDDTTVLHRHGPDALSYVRHKADEILALGGLFTSKGKSALLKLDADFIARRISPGGSADLLAATYFLWLAETNANV